MTTEEDKCSKTLKKKQYLIKEQNKQLEAANAEVESCYKHSNETAKNLEQLTSSCGNYIDQDKLKEFQKDTSACQGNGFIIDNIFCPISNKMNEFWEPLPAWGKDAAIATGLTAIGFIGYSLYPNAPTFKDNYIATLRTYYEEIGKDPTVINGLIQGFISTTKEMDYQGIMGVLNHFLEAAN